MLKISRTKTITITTNTFFNFLARESRFVEDKIGGSVDKSNLHSRQDLITRI